jgi:hypothetical protein
MLYSATQMQFKGEPLSLGILSPRPFQNEAPGQNYKETQPKQAPSD